MIRTGRFPALFVFGLAWLASRQGSAAPESVGVKPGTVVRWAGKGASHCQIAGRTVEPTDGECFFAIDLMHKEGPVSLSRERGGVQENATIRVQPSPYRTERITLHKKYVELKPRDLERVKREQKVLADVLSRSAPATFSFPIARPLADPPPGRNFGTKRIFNGEERQPHSGVDYAVPTGTPVLASENGRVALVADHFMPGRIVVLDHGGGLFSMYIHLSKALVVEGATVRRGERVGLSGATGRVSGPHLHFGVRWQGARLDPEQLYTSPERWPAIETVVAAAPESRPPG